MSRLPPTRISPLVAYRAEHGFLTTSTLYGRMCHILHTCTLNSSSLSVYDTPVGLGLNTAAWMNQRPAYLLSFDLRSICLKSGVCSNAWWLSSLARAIWYARIGTCCCKHIDPDIVGSLFRHAVWKRRHAVWGVETCSSFCNDIVRTVIWGHVSLHLAQLRRTHMDPLLKKQSR